jgi:hypothetical protein
MLELVFDKWVDYNMESLKSYGLLLLFSLKWIDHYLLGQIGNPLLCPRAPVPWGLHNKPMVSSILQVMHPFFEQNNLLLPFRASVIGLFFKLLFIAIGVTFAFRCKHWWSPLFCHACLWFCSNPTTLPTWLWCCSIHKMLLNLLLMWSFPPATNATISKYSNYG